MTRLPDYAKIDWQRGGGRETSASKAPWPTPEGVDIPPLAPAADRLPGVAAVTPEVVRRAAQGGSVSSGLPVAFVTSK